MEILVSIIAVAWVFAVVLGIGVSFVFGFPLTVGFLAILISQLDREKSQSGK